MVHIRGRDSARGSGGSPRGEVGEIDTRAPFQSVKAAVSLFGEVVNKGNRSPAVKRSSRLSSESVLEKETQLMLVQRELSKYKQQLESSEKTKTKVNADLQLAKRTLEELTAKVKAVTESKQAAVEASDDIKKKARELEVASPQKSSGQNNELEKARSQYIIVAKELDVAKQELNKIRQDFDATLEAKQASFQLAAEAQRSANVNAERVSELTKEIKAMRESAEQLKAASAQAQEHHEALMAEKDARVEVCKTGKQEAEKNLEALKREYDPESTKDLEVKLAETTAEIEVLQEEMKKAHAQEMDAMKVVTAELNSATKALQEIADEENSLRNTLSSLRMEMEAVKNEQAELEAKEAEREAATRAKLEKIIKETEFAVREAEEMKKNVESLKQETESAKSAAVDMQEKLEVALKEAEEAKAIAQRAKDAIKALSEGQNAQNDKSSGMIKISTEEYEALKKKCVESESLAETKVAEAIAQVTVINASKSEAAAKIEANLKAIEEINEATEIALKSAEMAEAAQNVVEVELQKWRQEKEL